MSEKKEAILMIAVIDAGHVLVGRTEDRGESGDVLIYGARTIRRWGTTRGLGQLYTGPTEETILDDKVPLIIVPRNKVIYLLPVEENPSWGID